MDEFISLLDEEEHQPNHVGSIDAKSCDKVALKEVDLNLFGNEVSASNPLSTQQNKSILHTGDIDSSDDEDLRNLSSSKYNEYGKGIKIALKSQSEASSSSPRLANSDTNTWKKTREGNQLITKTVPKSQPIKNETTVDVFSGIAIKNPVVSSVEMKERMIGRRLIQISNIAMSTIGGDIEGDWVTVGVIVKKLDQKKSSKGNMYSIWNMSDLKDCSKSISLFLFGKTHNEHWKTSVGSVIGILNPSVMPPGESYKDKGCSITVDNPQKILFMGYSRDFGTCKGIRKDGASCTMFINKSVCEFCTFHVSKEYYKSSRKRMDLQASFSSGEPKGLKQKLLEKQGIFYGGQYFSPARAAEKPTKSNKSKPAGIMSSMSQSLQKKANVMVADAKKEAASNIEAKPDTINYSNGITSGSRNLIHLVKKENCLNKGVVDVKQQQIQSITPKELLKMHAAELAKKTVFQRKAELTKNVMNLFPSPSLGNGIKAGETISLTSSSGFVNRAKMRAMQMIKCIGPIEKKNPNFVPKQRHSTEFQERIKKRLADDPDASTDNPPTPASKRTKMDLTSSEEFQKLLNRKSNHDYLAQEHDLEKQNNYFGFMEKKEQVETKMTSTMEIPCKAVSCKNCNYTALAALDNCRQEGHKLIVTNATKRFFMCKQCKTRTYSLSKLPTKPCSRCGERNFERVSMIKERKLPKLENEQLLLRGHEINSLNSTAYLNSSKIL